MTELAPEGAGQAEGLAPDAEGQATWYESANDEVKGYIQNKGWDDPLKAVSSYQELEKYRGASEDQLIKLPKEGESYDAVYDRLGRPESSDKYEFEAPENASIDTDRLDTFKGIAHSAGLNNEQFAKVVSEISSYETGIVQQLQEQRAQEQATQLEALKKEWGDGFDERAELGRRFVRKNLPADMNREETLNAIENAIGTAAMLKLFANSGTGAGEDRLPKDGEDKPYGYTREQAIADKKALMSELKASPERLVSYNSAKGPDYDKMQRLNKMLAG
jgi:hypothetical protein